jgi:hypothetical protein
MSHRVPLNSPEGRRLVEQGPAWREHPDYYREEPPEEVPTCDSCGSTGTLTFSPLHTAHFCPTCHAREMPPWHTEQHVEEAAARMKAWTQGQADILADARWCDLTDEEWRSLARVALEVER